MSNLGQWQLISATKLAADTANVSITSIPQTYKHLQLFFSVRSNVAADNVTLRMTVNSITTASYNDQWFYGQTNTSGTAGMQGSGSTTTKAAYMESALYIPTANWSANYFTSGYINIFSYSTASVYKVQSLSGGTPPASGKFIRAGGHWGQQDSSNGGITSIQLFPSSGSMATNSSFYLFGMKD